MNNTPFNYTGSKYKLLSQLLPEFNYTKTRFIDMFCGGGSVYVNVLDKYSTLVVNDLISDLIGIHKSLHEGDGIIESVKQLCPKNKSEFLSLRESYNENPTPDKLWALMLSCTNNMMRFNKKFKFNQTYGERGWNPNTEKKLNEFLLIRTKKILFENKHFKDIDVDFNDMVYLDPPYTTTEAGYNCYWGQKDDLVLYEKIKQINNIGASFCLSGVLNHDGQFHWLLEQPIKDGFVWKELEMDYDKVSRKKINKNTQEIIIKNY